MIDFQELKNMRISETIIDRAGFKEFKYHKKSQVYEMIEKVNNGTYHYYFELYKSENNINGLDINIEIDVLSKYLKLKKGGDING